MAKPTSARPTFKYVSADSLRFDPTNPRFGGSITANASPERIQQVLEQAPHYALDLVDSLLENGFIDYEPLVVRQVDDTYTVIEGNRRLAAVRHIRANKAKYASRSTRLDDLDLIPVLIFPDQPGPQEKQEQRVYLGVRHMFGFREWPAESKARFLHANVTNKTTLQRTLQELNIKKNEVRRYLVPYRLQRRASAAWAPYKNEDFWVLGESLNRRGVKEYIELDVDDESLDIRGYSEPKLKFLLRFVYGEPNLTDSKKRINETRDISKLATALQSKRAAKALEAGKALGEALVLAESNQESAKRTRQLLKELKLLLRRLVETRKWPKVRQALDVITHSLRESSADGE